MLPCFRAENDPRRTRQDYAGLATMGNTKYQPGSRITLVASRPLLGGEGAGGGTIVETKHKMENESLSS